MTSSPHISTDRIMEYFTEAMPDYEQAAIERHLATCESCAELARRTFQISHAFSLDAHAASDEAAAFRADPLVRALEAASQLYVDLEQRLRTWLESAQAVWKVSGLQEAMIGSGPVPVHGRTASARIVRLGLDIRRARVTIRGESQTLEVRLTHRPDTPAPLVVLFTSAAEPEVRAMIASPESGTDLVARFENLEPGEFQIAIEPRS